MERRVPFLASRLQGFGTRICAEMSDLAVRTGSINLGQGFPDTDGKIGWVSGPEALVGAVRTAKRFLTYVSGAPFQPAVAVGLALGDGYYDGLRTSLAAKRDLLCDGLAKAGFEVHRPAGTYFATVDVRPLGFQDGVDLCRTMPERCGVVAVPSSAFYLDPARGRHLVRFAFCKRDDVLAEAVERLGQL